VIVRRVFYYWQFIAVLALPAWLLLGASIFRSSGWAVLGSLFGGILLGLGLLLVALLVYARTEVRAQRAVSWWDVGVLTLWHALIVATGFSTGSSGLPILVVLAGLAVFWFVLWELFTSARRHVQDMMVVLDETARGVNRSGDPATQHPSPAAPGFDATADPSIIVVREKPSDA
jgi:hypothetical protein